MITAIHAHRDLGRGLSGARKLWRLLGQRAALGEVVIVVVDAIWARSHAARWNGKCARLG